MKNQKGITLIALAVTIIVLIILAGVTIAMLRGDNSIISNAQKAKNLTVQDGAVTRIQMAYQAVQMQLKIDEATSYGYNVGKEGNFEKLGNVAFGDLCGDNTAKIPDMTDKFFSADGKQTMEWKAVDKEYQIQLVEGNLSNDNDPYKIQIRFVTNGFDKDVNGGIGPNLPIIGTITINKNNNANLSFVTGEGEDAVETDKQIQ